MARALPAPLAVVSVLASPVLIHLAILRQDRLLEWIVLVLLAGVALIDGLTRLRLSIWCLWITLAAMFAWFVTHADARLALQLPSIAIPALLALIFGSTLRAGQETLVTRIASAARPGPMPPALHRYTRSLTQAWTLVFIFLAVTAALLTAFASHETWSLVANLGTYVLLGLMFVGEYIYRRLRFRDYPHPSFVEYIGILFRANLRGTR